MAEKEPNNNNLNPGDNTWNNKFESSGTPSNLHSLETAGNSADSVKNKPSNDLGDAVRNHENTNGAWANNVTGTPLAPGGMKGFGNKAKLVLKKKGATVAIIALLGGGAAVPFLGAAALPFSIVGNMNAKSMLHGLNQYSEDYYGFRIFTSDKASVSTTGSKIRGLSDSEITQLKNNGVDFEGAKKNPVTGKTTFSAVKYEGQTLHAGSEFNTAMRGNAALRSAMVFDKGSYWKSAKSDFAAKVKNLFKIDPNPDLSGKTEAEKNKKLYNEATEGTPNATAEATGTQETKNQNGVDPNAAERAQGESVANALNDEVAAERAVIETGAYTPAMAADSSMADVARQFSKPGTNVVAGVSDSLGSKMWDSVNALSPLTMMCTVYQVANTANTLARTVALFNIVRFSITVITTIERTMAGDDTTQSTQYLMDIMQRKDPSTGQSFDQTSYATFLFNGQASAQPSAVSSFGGQSMMALYLAMHAVHSMFGDIISASTAGAIGSSAANGRQFLKDTCNVATNFGAQALATGFAVFVGIFSGGAASAGEVGIEVAMKAGVKSISEKLVSIFGKDAIKALIKKETEKVGADGAMNTLASHTWSLFTKLWSNLTIWDKFGLLVAGASSFGMAYIVDALAGGNIAGFIGNGFSAFDAIGTGWNQYESVNGIASGGNMATYDQAAAYQQTKQTSDSSYVADMQYRAKDTPLNLKNPYSVLGSAMFSMQKMIGVSASLNMSSTIAAVAALPFQLPGLFTAHADSAPTPKQIGDQVGNPYYQKNQLAVTVTGSPQVTFQKHYSFQNILDKLVDSSNPQISYGGNDPTSGDPILTVITQHSASDSNLSLSDYISKCHNPDKTEPDPEFADDGNSNVYDINTCIPGKSGYNDNVYPLYDDAIRFLGQVNPDASAATAAADAAGDTSGTGTANGPAAGTSGRDDVPAKWKAMDLACIAQIGGACTSTSWLGMLPGQCAAFTSWRTVQQWYGSLLATDGSNLAQLLQSHPLPHFGSSLAMGNGVQVATNLIASGMASRVSGGYANVQPGDIVSVRTNNAAGHVFVILSVSGGVITVEDYNAAGGPGRYGTKKTTDWPLYNASNIIAIARVHKNGGVK